MIGWAQRTRDGWRTRSRHAQAEASIRWSLIPLPWFLPFVGLAPLPAEAGTPTARALVWALIGLNAAMSATSSFTVRRALDAYVGARPAPWRGIALLGAQLTAATALTVGSVATGALPGDVAGPALLGPTGSFLLPYGLLAGIRTLGLTLAGLVGVHLTVFGCVGMDGGEMTGVAVATALGGVGVAVSSRCSGWYLAVMRELDEARDVQSRLAVAEERLRFGRDLHDVLGRNLSVIALKSELAVQLARRGGEVETTVDQMVEVQRIARDSQREVRDVVRGYREADLVTELAGARGVLRAAGVDCRADSHGAAARLPEGVRAALGWVVREGTTNVLRHADATHCRIAVHREGSEAVLTMENDGVRRSAADGGGGGGAGLTGLRERLAVLDGTLAAERPAASRFRLTARVPLPRTADDGPRLGHAAGAAAPARGTASGGQAADGEAADEEAATSVAGRRDGATGTPGEDARSAAAVREGAR